MTAAENSSTHPSETLELDFMLAHSHSLSV